ncbi:hypothetical protein R3P38DRAFT_887117 [Favolaschia claudopus]|uniref:Uncharacterized protein n=1 Tax=Favolaschia claudopus TaxID=2862362 RepID=A0AAW0BRN1_9AGAR
MIRPRHGYTLLASEQSETQSPPSPASPLFSFDDSDDEEKLTRPRPIAYPHDPRFDQPTPPAWQRAGLILFIVSCLFLAVWLQNGFWIGAVV